MARASRPSTLTHGMLLLWLAIVAVALVLAYLVWASSRQGSEAQLRRAGLSSAAACAAIVAALERTRALPAADQATQRAAMDAAVDLALRDAVGIEGGLWQAGPGVVAYAFPTYDGSGIKRDVPDAERERIEALAARAAAAGQAMTDLRPGLRETVLLQACPGAAGAPVGWTLTRVPTVAAEGLDRLVLVLGLLLTFVLLSGGWLGWTLQRWTRGLQTLIDGLRHAAPGHAPALLTTTGLADLDRVGDALNDYAQRLHQAQMQAGQLTKELAHSQRLAALGRLSAGLAHEIRNPLGTIRLKAENALAAPREAAPERSHAALQAVLSQAQRLEALVDSLLALTQPFEVVRRCVPLEAWLRERCLQHAEAAAARSVTLDVTVDPGLAARAEGVALFDPVPLARAIDNLTLNAIAHAAPGSTVRIGATATPSGAWCLSVEDHGPGVAPELMPRLFEPFASARAGGIGLGLALVREIAQAHGGTVRHRPVEPHGARFEMELPWPVS